MSSQRLLSPADFVEIAFSDTLVWKETKNYKSDGIIIYTAPSAYMSEKMIKGVTILEVSVEKAVALCNPTMPYRVTWDPILESLRVVEAKGRHTHIVHHMTHPSLGGLVVGRDTVDLVHVGIRGGVYYIAACSVRCDDVPAGNVYKRNWQWPSGYLFERLGDDKCKWTVIFQSELGLPKLAALAMPLVKPQLLYNKMVALKTMAKAAVVHEDHLATIRDVVTAQEEEQKSYVIGLL